MSSKAAVLERMRNGERLVFRHYKVKFWAGACFDGDSKPIPDRVLQSLEKGHIEVDEEGSKELADPFVPARLYRLVDE